MIKHQQLLQQVLLLQTALEETKKEIGIQQFDYDLKVRYLEIELKEANKQLEEADDLIADLSSELHRAVEEVKRLRQQGAKV